MAESSKPTPPIHTTQEKPPASPQSLAIGTIVLVRSTLNSLAPAIVTNDFAGQNTAGACSLIVFNSASFDNQPIKVVPNAQAESFEIDAEDLSRELFMWWQPVGSSLVDRDLQAEIDKKRAKDTDAKDKDKDPAVSSS